MSLSSSVHQAKKPYAGFYSQNQSQITSYFTPADATAVAPSPQTTSQQNLHLFPATTTSPYTAPHLPATVQSNLLSVGMRVRKSVPEGYKTGGCYGALGLFHEAASGALRQPAPEASCGGGGAAPFSSSSSSSSALPRPAPAGMRELAPFCGILKTGGWAQQEEQPHGRAGSPALLPDEEDVPFLSSQGSTVSGCSVRTAADDWRAGAGRANNKRRFDNDEGSNSSNDDNNNDNNDNNNKNNNNNNNKINGSQLLRLVPPAPTDDGRHRIWHDESVSPRTKTPTPPPPPSSSSQQQQQQWWRDAGTPLGERRPMALPRRRAPKRYAGAGDAVKFVGGGASAVATEEEQENADVPMDFGEAEFLDFEGALAQVREVDMLEV